MPKKDFMYQLKNIIQELFIDDLWDDSTSSHSKKKCSKKKNKSSKKNHHNHHNHQNIQMNIQPSFQNDEFHHSYQNTQFYSNNNQYYQQQECNCNYHQSLKQHNKEQLENEINQAFHS